MSEQYTPINKGNYTLETPERMRLVQQYLSEGWESQYTEYRRQWVENPVEKKVGDYPLLLDLELSTACNLRCPMCYTITEEFKSKVKAQFMDFSLFTKILNEIEGKIPAVRLSLRGESTLHPRFLDCIRLCKEKGIGEVSFLTNGSKLSEPFIRELIAAGADWITVSIDGMGETYEGIRAPLKFADTLAGIQRFHRIKQELGVTRPVLKVQSIWPAIRGQAESFYNTFAPYVDWIAFNPLIDYLENDSAIQYVEKFFCPQLYQRLIISAQGNALMCTNDEREEHVVGNANQHSIHEIWHGQKLSDMRMTHGCIKGFVKIPKCLHCFLPRATEDGEREQVNGREIIIENYVGRAQEVGQ